MAILPIYVYDHKILRQKSKPVVTIDDQVRAFAESMVETMKYSDGIGLAANQVGSEAAICTVDVSEVEGYEGTKPIIMVNPTILYYSDKVKDAEEGCLSLPELRERVTRPIEVQIQFYDLQGKEHTHEYGGLPARVMQHEIDHLSGIFFFDRLSPIKKTLAQSKLRRIQRGDTHQEYSVVLGDESVIEYRPD